MPHIPGSKGVVLEGEDYHVRSRDPDEFDEIRTPEWASTAARDVSAGSRARMGRRGDDWVVESVLIETHVGKSTAREQAERVVRKIEG